MAKDIRNIVFEGGGVKGIAYVGALQELEKRDVLSGVERVGGTSAGAITALLVGLNYSPKEIEKIMMDLEFVEFLESCHLPINNITSLSDWRKFIGENKTWWIWTLLLFAKLYFTYGLCEGKNISKWISERIKEKVEVRDPTFRELYKLDNAENFRKMYFIGSNLSKGVSEVYSLEDTPGLSVIDAVRISMSFPLVFTPLKREGTSIDGGVIRNYPIRLFDRERYLGGNLKPEENFDFKDKTRENNQEDGRGEQVFNKETLGFRLDSEEEIADFRRDEEPEPQEINDLWEYLMGLLNTMMSVQQSYHRRGPDWKRTAYINTLGVSTLDFTLKDKTKKKLIREGKKGVKIHFKERFG